MTAIHTGHMWASEDGSRILENVKAWEEIPADDSDLEIKNLPETLERPPTPGADDGGEEE